ncbi:MAG: SPOR domain-containing protein [Mariprofundaceae bacterium]
MLQTWLVSRTEHKTALIISLICATVVVATVIQFFFFSELPQETIHEPSKVKQASISTTPVKITAPTPKKEKEIVNHQHSKTSSPIVVKSNPKPMAEKTKHPALPQGYYVQLGAFKEIKRAQAMVQQLKRWKPRLAPRKGLNAVWIGPFASRNLADQAKTKLHKDSKLQGFIIKH